MIGNKKQDPFKYLMNIQNEEQRNIFNPYPGSGEEFTKYAPKLEGQQTPPGLRPVKELAPQGAGRPQVQYEAPRDYYTDPLTGESTGMTYDAFVENWNASPTANYFDSYESYLGYMQYASEQTGFDPVWNLGQQASHNAPFLGEGPPMSEFEGSMQIGSDMINPGVPGRGGNTGKRRKPGY